MEKAPDAFRTISEVSKWLGVPAHVLRFWESRFPEIQPVKRAGGRRYYRPEDVSLIGGIKTMLHEQGDSIKAVQDLLASDGIDAVSALSPPLATPAEGGGDDGEAPAEPAKPSRLTFGAPPAADDASAPEEAAEPEVAEDPEPEAPAPIAPPQAEALPPETPPLEELAPEIVAADDVAQSAQEKKPLTGFGPGLDADLDDAPGLDLDAVPEDEAALDTDAIVASDDPETLPLEDAPEPKPEAPASATPSGFSSRRGRRPASGSSAPTPEPAAPPRRRSSRAAKPSSDDAPSDADRPIQGFFFNDLGEDATPTPTEEDIALGMPEDAVATAPDTKAERPGRHGLRLVPDPLPEEEDAPTETPADAVSAKPTLPKDPPEPDLSLPRPPSLAADLRGLTAANQRARLGDASLRETRETLQSLHARLSARA